MNGGPLVASASHYSNEAHWSLSQAGKRFFGILCVLFTQYTPSFRKRLASRSKASPVLPEALTAIWKPLLETVQSRHPLFVSSLVSSAVNVLCSQARDSAERLPTKDDITYQLCVAAWVALVIQDIHTSQEIRSTASAITSRKEALLEELLVSTGSRFNGENGDLVGQG